MTVHESRNAGADAVDESRNADTDAVDDSRNADTDAVDDSRNADTDAVEELPPPALDLSEPGTIEFTAERALAGRAFNRFALSLRSPAKRAEFLADEIDCMLKAGLSAAEMALVQEHDWTGLLRAGGHLHAVLKLAATVGQDLWSIGAHNVGCSRDALIAACPRQVSGLPEALD